MQGPIDKVVTQVLQEVTEWDDTAVINGLYALNKAGNLVAYAQNADVPFKIYAKPMKQFSKTRRKFQKISKSQWNQALTS
jgi:hypothetical protein|tara:strand:- start:60 stop:299 length:240 start_codon:yes stop_codon:yes gene_type:complete